MAAEPLVSTAALVAREAPAAVQLQALRLLGNAMIDDGAAAPHESFPGQGHATHACMGGRGRLQCGRAAWQMSGAAS